MIEESHPICQANDDKVNCLFLNHALGKLKLTPRLSAVNSDDQLKDYSTCKVHRLDLVLFLNQNNIFSFQNHSECNRTIEPCNENILYCNFRTIQL